MVNPGRQKGTAAETAVVEYLISAGYQNAERRALHGSNDRGDIAGIPGVVIEVKSEKTYRLTNAVREAKEEMKNAKAERYVAVLKPHGVGLGKGDQFFAVIELAEYVALLKLAGY